MIVKKEEWMGMKIIIIMNKELVWNSKEDYFHI